MRSGLVRGLGVLATVGSLAAAWWFLAPPQLGGRTSYAVVFGVSMEPHLHRGDLVLLRSHSGYRVGDVVAYRSTLLHRHVLHRIVGEHDGRFRFKGDNNSFVDPEQPPASDLVGSEWIRIPAAGAWLEDLHSPRNAAIAGGLIVLLLGATGGAPAARRRRRRAPAEERPRPAPARGGSGGSAGLALAAVGAGALAAAAVLGGLAFTRPPERSLVWANLYVQHGRFGYTAPVRPGAAYERPHVASGQPVYLRLVHRLPVSFSYRLQAPRARAVAGRIGLAAVLRDDQGWRHRIVVAPARPFSGTRATVRGLVDLRALRRTIAVFERETGEHNTLYHLTLVAAVHVHGTVARRPLAATFAPAAAFDLDELRLAPSAAAGDPGGPPGPLVRSAGGAGTRVEPGTLTAFGRAVTVAHARRLAVLLGAAGLALALAGGALLLLRRHGDEVSAIQRRYEDWIVDVLPRDRPSGAERRVATMEALARLAERYDRLILHERRGDGDTFLVEEDGVTYAYVVRRWDGALAVVR